MKPDGNAMCLSIVNAENLPSSRMVLLKKFDEAGYVFFTNKQSRKGKDILDNPHGALLFYWNVLHRQICIEGKIEEISEKESVDYFNTRSRESQISAWATEQSRELDDIKTFRNNIQHYQEKFSGKPVPFRLFGAVFG